MVLLESADACGGLLRSHSAARGMSYDMGTHIPALTGHESVDHLLFDLPALDWLEVPVLKAGNAFRGVLNDRSQFIDISQLSPGRYQECLVGLLNALEEQETSASLHEVLVGTMGEALAEEVFFPLLRRMFVAPLEQLSASNSRFLGYSRVIVGSAQLCRELKSSALYDGKIAYRDYLEGRSTIRHQYPRRGGVGSWIDALCARLLEQGAQVLTEARVVRVDSEGRRVALADSSVFEYERLIWTAPLAMLARTMGEPVTAVPPRFLSVRLLHFVLDRPAACDCHYVYLNDEGARTFRVTLYNNFQPCSEMPWRLTVEALDVPGETPEQQAQKVLAELRGNGVIGESCEAHLVLQQFIGNGFPEVTLAQEAASRDLRRHLQELAPDLLLCGRGGSEAFFTSEVLLDCAVQLERAFGLPRIHGESV